MNTDTTNTVLASENDNFNYIIGNIFFTIIIIIITITQFYVYYNINNDGKYICIFSFIVVFLGLFYISGNLPLSLITALFTVNLLFSCGSITNLTNIIHNKIFNNSADHDEEHDHADVAHESEKNKKEHALEQEEHPDKEKKHGEDKKDHEEPEDEPMPDLEMKNPKVAYLKAGNFEPYLTGEKNDFAYPAAPDILKFHS